MAEAPVPQEQTEAQQLWTKISEYENIVQQKDEQLENCRQSIAKLEALVSQIDNLKEQRAKDDEDANLRKDQADKYEKIIQQKDAQIEENKKTITKLEGLVSQIENLKRQRVKDAEEVNMLKDESEKTLTKAKSIIFERTKVMKNQELQIEALNQQNDSLKEVVRITKDLLEIRNLEVKQLEDKINMMDARMKGEKERQDLIHKKLETMIRHNGELKREYEAQLCLFSALRERYQERELARDVLDETRRDVEQERNAVANLMGNVPTVDPAPAAAPPLPAANGHSENSENPENSENVVNPENPENVGNPENPGKPENPETPEEAPKQE